MISELLREYENAAFTYGEADEGAANSNELFQTVTSAKQAILDHLKRQLIIVHAGYFADGKDTPAYQLARLSTDDDAYHVADSAPNHPATLTVIQTRLREWALAETEEGAQ